VRRTRLSRMDSTPNSASVALGWADIRADAAAVEEALTGASNLVRASKRSTSARRVMCDVRWMRDSQPGRYLRRTGSRPVRDARVRLAWTRRRAQRPDLIRQTIEPMLRPSKNRQPAPTSSRTLASARRVLGACCAMCDVRLMRLATRSIVTTNDKQASARRACSSRVGSTPNSASVALDSADIRADAADAKGPRTRSNSVSGTSTHSTSARRVMRDARCAVCDVRRMRDSRHPFDIYDEREADERATTALLSHELQLELSVRCTRSGCRSAQSSQAFVDFANRSECREPSRRSTSPFDPMRRINRSGSRAACRRRRTARRVRRLRTA